MAQVFDVVVVGGGTAGAIVAARLSEDPTLSVCLFEAGPPTSASTTCCSCAAGCRCSRAARPRLHHDAAAARQRAHRALAGGRAGRTARRTTRRSTSSRFPADWQDWVDRGARAGSRDDGALPPPLQTKHQIVAEKDRNPILKDWIPAAAAAPACRRTPTGTPAPFPDGVGFLDVGYDPATGMRSSSSVAYLHPIMGRRPNLIIRTETWVRRVNLERPRRRRSRHRRRRQTRRARREIVVCGGSVDTPRLLLLSGIGPARRPARARHRGASTTCPASART